MVIPAYNVAATVASAVLSVLQQTRQDFEVIVVDDGSTDATAARVRAATSDRRVRLIVQENRGLAGARNAAIAHAQGRYLCLLDGDDLLLPRYLEVMGAALDGDPEAALAYADAWVLDDRTRRIRRRTAMAGTGGPDDPPRDPRAFLALLVHGNFVYGGVTARRSAVEEVGGFDESLRALEDYDLWLRLVSRGNVVIRVPEVLAIYRHRFGALSNDDRLITAGLRDLCARLAASPALGPQDQAVARARVATYDEALATLPDETAASSGGTRLSDREGPGLRRRVKRLLWRREWFAHPPPDVHAAFPDLGRV